MGDNKKPPNQPGAHLRPDTLAASVAILLLSAVVQRSIGFGRGVLFCRWLPPDELGTWELANSFLLLAAPVVVLGLPGSFGRYLERFRQRGQLRTFLRRASIWTATLTAAAVGLVLIAARQFSELIFGRPDEQSLVILLAVSLAAVILHHFLEALFAALRKFSIMSAMHFCQSMLFAALSLGLLWFWRFAAESIVIGYGMSCLVSACGALAWKGRALAAEAAPDGGVAHREFWPPLVRFAVWVWLTNLLCHLFGVIDRYMLVHWSGLDNEAALALVGQYHASRIVPLLFLSVADLLAGIVLPYLSHDWEAGARQRVSDRLNLVLKLTSLVTLAGGVVVLWAAPLLFHVAFEGRYDEGLSVLPWTLTYCVWYSLLHVAQNYIWCAERAKWSTVPLAAGLVINVGLNVVLIPAWGLLGAVISTTAATGSALGVLYWINHRAGMRLQRGMILLTMAPAVLSAGAGCATAAFVALAVALPFSQTLFTREECDSLVQLARTQLEKFSALWSRQAKPTEPSHAV
jgi:O-antigen/teichoic acid export membrane protein